MTLSFAFLVLKEHPYGREMLRLLLEPDLRPLVIIQEASPVADEERAKFLTRIAGQPVPPTIAQLTHGLGIPQHEVANHNNEECQRLLRRYGPELVVLGGTRIIRPALLDIPPQGTVNAHPGLLPQLRGSSSVGWALYQDLPVGSTIHFIDQNIDTGPIILRQHLPIYRNDSYEQIVRRVLTLSGSLMAEALTMLERGPVAATPQDPAAGETLRVIPPELLQQAKTRLAQGRYSHFVEE